VAMTPQQEAEYVLAYGQRDDCSSAETRAEYDRLKEAPKPRFDPPLKKEVSSSAGKAAAALPAALPAALGSLVVAALVLIGGIILQAVSGSKAGLCNTVIGQFAQQQSTGTAVNCGLWTGLDTFGQVLTWLGGIGAVALAILLALTWMSKPR
jgi:anti-sigma factor RsiW